MKRITTCLLTLVLIAALVLSTLGIWILGTADGARWLLSEVSRFTPMSVEADVIDGRIWGNLRVQGLKLSWPEGTAAAREFALRWKPAMLFSRRIDADLLTAAGVTIQDNRPESDVPPSLNWPTVSGGLLTRVAGRIHELSVKDLSYRRGSSDPLVVTSASADLGLDQGKLTLRRFAVTMPQFRAEGSLELGLVIPGLRFQTSLVPAAPVAAMERFDLKVNIRQAGSPDLAEGVVRVEGISGKKTAAVIRGEIRTREHSLVFRNLRGERPGLRGSVSGEGEISFVAKGPHVHARLAFAEIDLSRELQVPADLSGSVEIDGGMDSYGGTLSLSSRGAGWHEGALSASFRGTPDSIAVTSLRGNWLSGTVSGRAKAAWKKGISLETDLEARGLDPSGISATWSGSVNADVSGSIVVAKAGTPEGRLSLRLLESRIKDQSVSGEARGRLKGGNIHLDLFAFRGKGFELTASGDSEKLVNVAARLSDLSLVLPGAGGAVTVDGRVRRTRGRLSGDVAAHAVDLQLAGVKAKSADLSVLLEDIEGSPLTIKAGLEELSYDILQIQAVTLDAKGTVGSTERFNLSGSLSASQGSIGGRVRDVALKAMLNQADLSWSWSGSELSGRFAVVLAEYGQAEADFRLPIPAAFPVAPRRDGPLTVNLRGDFEESGILSVLFPGLVQESRGRIVPEIRAGGTWAKPVVNGSLLLEKAGAYVPSAGIQVSDVRLEAQIVHNRIIISSLSARSGPGSIEAKAVVTLAGWQSVHYEGSLKGERFQVLFLPDIQMLASPNLEFDGTEKGLSLRGEVKLPELLITGPPVETAVRPSEDVVIISSTGPPEETGRPFSVDVRVKFILGERVIVKVKGVDAQLGGEVLLSAKSLRELTGAGEISVSKGSYSTYGVSLDITRGRVLFAGGPVDNPTLDILALRTIDEVRAGVFIGGVLQKPIIRLYSEPPLPDADILAYMVLGHPLGQDQAQGDYLMQAAAVILSAGQSVSLQDQLKHRLGIDTIQVQTGEGEVARSVVTVGKYLSPKLYVSYGRSLFTGENLFMLRYRFSRRWEVETKSGETSSADLYYTIRFD